MTKKKSITDGDYLRSLVRNLSESYPLYDSYVEHKLLRISLRLDEIDATQKLLGKTLDFFEKKMKEDKEKQ